MRMLSRPALGVGPFATQRLGSPFLGLDLDDLFDAEGLSASIIDVLGRLPDSVKGRYQAKYDECQRQLSAGGIEALYKGGRCLKELYDDVRNEEGRQRPPTGQRPPESGFPWIPVVAVGALGVAAAVYFALR
jgi:hypothetical protein